MMMNIRYFRNRSRIRTDFKLYNKTMKCPKCDKEMRKVRWEITNNFRTGKDFIEYDKLTYVCKDDDIWLSTEIPMLKEDSSKTKKQKST